MKRPNPRNPASLRYRRALRRAPYELSPEERVDLEEALAEVERGELASDAQVAALFVRLDMPRR